jgi:predicted RNA-binding Zn-ribbon protein involved in translation (DUF1610 family)
MSYKNTLQKVDTEKALSLIGIEYQTQGAYVKFPCPNCKEQAVIKAYGDKKNLYYCPRCKVSGHIISLVMKVLGTDWNNANKLLIKAEATTKRIANELTMKYELQYHHFLESQGISEKTCRDLEIGVPKGKTMLAGCIAFAVHDEEGRKIAYYGIRIKDLKPVFHKSFNPELYVFNFFNVDSKEPVYFSSNMFECIKNIEQGRQCMSNFGLPYLSRFQLDLLRYYEKIVFLVDESLVKPFAVQMAESQMNYYRFEN